MNDQLCTKIAKLEFRSIVESYLHRLDDFWTQVLDREIRYEQESLSSSRWFIFPAKIPNATLDDAKASLINKWNHSYNHWNRLYLDSKEEAELLIKFIDDSVEDAIEVPFNRYHVLTREKISD